MILQLLGTVIFVGLFVFAFFWPWIAEEIITREHEKEEKNDPFVHICHCEECGYTGRISLARNGRWSRVLDQVAWNCPNCGNHLWDKEDVKLVWRDEEEKEIECIKKGGAL